MEGGRGSKVKAKGGITITTMKMSMKNGVAEKTMDNSVLLEGWTVQVTTVVVDTEARKAESMMGLKGVVMVVHKAEDTVVHRAEDTVINKVVDMVARKVEDTAAHKAEDTVARKVGNTAVHKVMADMADVKMGNTVAHKAMADMAGVKESMES